jgi:hypothetical protein
MRSAAARRFDGAADFATRIEPGLRALPFFRAPTDEEIAVVVAAYRARDFARMLDDWRAVAQPTRATLGPTLTAFYDRAHLAPRAANAAAFLASIRAVLDAGVRFRATLPPSVRAALESEFPWLERRHEHVPPGWTPRFDFPDGFAAFVSAPDGDLDDARARWQLVCALNEVQQACYSAHAAERFRLPELHRHAARERELALHYFSRWAPDASDALLRQCLFVLDGLNAAVFAMMCKDRPAEMIARSLFSAVTRGDEWQRFVEAMDRPQALGG